MGCYVKTKMKMPIEIAKRVQELRAGPIMHSWRRISEIICDEYPEYVENTWGPVENSTGIQLHGIELCDEAREALNISQEEYEEKWG